MQEHIILIRLMHIARVFAVIPQMIHDTMQEKGSAQCSGARETRVFDATWIYVDRLASVSPAFHFVPRKGKPFSGTLARP